MSSKRWATNLLLGVLAISFCAAAASLGNCVVNGSTPCCDLITTGGPVDHGPCPASPPGADCSDIAYGNPTVAYVQMAHSGYKDHAEAQSGVACDFDKYSCEKVMSGYMCIYLLTDHKMCTPTKIPEVNTCTKP